MSSPDVTPYVDLTLLDLDPQQIFANALALATTRFPDWTPLEGNVEVVLLEAMSEVVAELVFAINRLPAAVLEVVLRLYGLTRSPGTLPVATATFTLADSGGHTIPQGTVLRVDPTTGLDPVLFTTDTDLPVAAGQTTGTVAITATVHTADVNGTAPGTELTVVSSVPYVDDAVLGATVTGGLGPETGYDFLNRARLRLQQISTTLVLARQFEAAAAEHAGVVRVRGVDNWNADAAAASTNHVTVAVLGAGGVALSTSDKAAIASDLTARALAGLAVHVTDVTATTVSVDVSVVRLANYTTAQVQASVQSAIQQYLNPDTWPLGPSTVYVNEIIAAVDRAQGVDRVVGTPKLNGSAADLAITGLVPVPVAGTVTTAVAYP